jgi:hypothetical protein
MLGRAWGTQLMEPAAAHSATNLQAGSHHTVSDSGHELANVVSDVVMSARRVPVSTSDEVETIVKQVLDGLKKRLLSIPAGMYREDVVLYM